VENYAFQVFGKDKTKI
ncbi:Hypp9675, partial [Branchiostoma lanceolatum]